MKVIGIIAEYNPFHNGHAYQIKKIKEQTQADFVVAAMSGNFVQRGAPAIIDKYARTKMALNCGADLVIELPALWATASAEYFAMAGVALFDKMGCVNGICFGAETDDLALLSTLADILVSEPKEYRTALSAYLKKGLAFPVARAKALCGYFTQIHDNDACLSGTITPSGNLEDISSILNEPNNILAIEYLKALKRRNSAITPYVIKREGAGYHDTEIAGQTNVCDSAAALTNCAPDAALANCASDAALAFPAASATAIRKTLETFPAKKDCLPTALLAAAMPPSALEILEAYLTDNTLVQANDFSSILGYQLLTTNVDVLAGIGDSNADLANRICKNRMRFSSFEQFCELNKSKEVTYTRISRVLLHLFLNITNQNYIQGKELDYIPYLKILGFRKNSSALLKQLKEHSQVPVISKLADASSLLSVNAMAVLEKDIFAADLYSQICALKTGTTARSEFAREIVRV